MSPDLTQTSSTPSGFPRVSGDEPSIGWGIKWAVEFSPRERG